MADLMEIELLLARYAFAMTTDGIGSPMEVVALYGAYCSIGRQKALAEGASTR